MNQFEMPYLFIFSNEELCRLWSAYRQIARVIRENQERTHIAILEDTFFRERQNLCFLCASACDPLRLMSPKRFAFFPSSVSVSPVLLSNPRVFFSEYAILFGINKLKY